MRHTAIPDNQIAWLRADLDPLQSVISEPLHPVLREPEPLRSPGWDAWLGGHLAVELLGQFVAPWADD